jgi:hypothetical protein
MVVAVSAMWMMQVRSDDEIHVVAVRYGSVTTSRRMFVIGVVLAALVGRGAIGWVGAADGELVLVDVVGVHIVHVTVVQVVGVAVVRDRRMTATCPVGVCVTGVLLAAHVSSLLALGTGGKAFKWYALSEPLRRLVEMTRN